MSRRDEASEQDPARLIECPQCHRVVPFFHLRRKPTAQGVPDDDLTADHVTCATCLGEQKLDGHFVHEWWILIGRFCVEFEHCSTVIESFIVNAQRHSGEKPTKVDVSAAYVFSEAMRHLKKHDGVDRQRKALNQFKRLTKVRNKIVHSAWSFRETRADPRDEPDTTDVLEARRYDHRAEEWTDRTMKFDELEKAVKDVEALLRELSWATFFMAFKKPKRAKA